LIDFCLSLADKSQNRVQNLDQIPIIVLAP